MKVTIEIEVTEGTDVYPHLAKLTDMYAQGFTDYVYVHPSGRSHLVVNNPQPDPEPDFPVIGLQVRNSSDGEVTRIGFGLITSRPDGHWNAYDVKGSRIIVDKYHSTGWWYYRNEEEYNQCMEDLMDHVFNPNQEYMEEEL